MARKPQLIANRVAFWALLLASLAPWRRPLVAQELRVTVSPDTKVIVNPFVQPPYAAVPQPATLTEQAVHPMDANVGARPPVVRGVWLSPDGGRQDHAVKNPFSGDDDVPARLRPLRWGSVSRWREPSIAPPTDSGDSDFEAPAAGPTGVQSATSVAKDPVQETPPKGQLRLLDQPVDLQPVPSEEDMEWLSGASSGDVSDNGAAESDLPTGVGGLREFVDWDGPAISQPAWLMPEGENNELIMAQQSGSIVKSESTGQSVSDRRPGANDQPFDPFEEPDIPAVVVSDIPSDETDSPLEADFERVPVLIAKLLQLAESAATIDELTDVINGCRTLAAEHSTLSQEEQVRSLLAWTHNRRGELLDEAGQVKNAFDDFQTAVELNPQDWRALHNRAIISARRGEHDLALGDFAVALEINPDLTVAYRNRGELLSTLGRTEAAINDYSAALMQQPADAELFALRAFARHRQRDYARAMDDYNQSLRLKTDSPLACTGRGNLFAEIGQFDRALDDYYRAVAFDPSFGDAYRGLAWLLATCPDGRYRDPEAALSAAHKAAEFGRAGDPFIFEALAAASASSQRFHEAVRYQQRALTIVSPSLAAPLRHRLALYMRQQPFFSGLPSGVQTASHESSVPK